MADEKFGIDSKAFGLRLNQARRENNVKQKELADFLGVTRPRISSCENGTPPGLSMVRGTKIFFTKECKYGRTYDYWIDGLTFDESMIKKGSNDQITLLQSMIHDKERIIAFQEEKIKLLEGMLNGK